MFTALRKIKKQGEEKPTELETNIAQAIFDLAFPCQPTQKLSYMR
jgi:hypothetical protein